MTREEVEMKAASVLGNDEYLVFIPERKIINSSKKDNEDLTRYLGLTRTLHTIY